MSSITMSRFFRIMSYSRHGLLPAKRYRNALPCVALQRHYTDYKESVLGKPTKDREELNERARLELATAYRTLDRLKLNEGVCNHLTLMAPAKDGDEDVMLLIPWGLQWNEVTPERLLGLNANNEVIEGYGEVEISAANIHRGVHDARPDAKAVFHTHMPYATTLACLKDPSLMMLHQNCIRFYNKIAFDLDYSGFATKGEEGCRSAKLLGDKPVLMMQNHGVLVGEKDCAFAFDQLYYLEKAAMFQVMALSTGREIKQLDEKFVAEVYKEVFNDDALRPYAEAHFYSYVRKIKEELMRQNK